jgi:hypothetical protein
MLSPYDGVDVVLLGHHWTCEAPEGDLFLAETGRLPVLLG